MQLRDVSSSGNQKPEGKLAVSTFVFNLQCRLSLLLNIVSVGLGILPAALPQPPLQLAACCPSCLALHPAAITTSSLHSCSHHSSLLSLDSCDFTPLSTFCSRVDIDCYCQRPAQLPTDQKETLSQTSIGPQTQSHFACLQDTIENIVNAIVDFLVHHQLPCSGLLLPVIEKLDNKTANSYLQDKRT